MLVSTKNRFGSYRHTWFLRREHCVSWIDVIALMVILVSTYRGAQRGAIWQLAALATVVVVAFLTSRLAPLVQVLLPDEVEGRFKPWIAVFILYAGTSFAIYLLARKLRLWFERARFAEFDRHWGAILGCSKGVLFVLVAAVVAIVAAPSWRPVMMRSRTGELAKMASFATATLLPGWMAVPVVESFEAEGRDD